MDWVKVARALDNEWWVREEVAKKYPTRSDAQHQQLLAMFAFMLRDCLVSGMTPEDKERVYEHGYPKR